MEIRRWGVMNGAQSIGIHFDPLSQGLVHVSIGKVFEIDDQTENQIYIPTHYIRKGNTDIPINNNGAAMAWNDNLSGVDIVIGSNQSYVEGSYMIFG